ncbi:hypothetical protein Btru_068043 [Bulinus truncatus]|nr:hypothetical protein Btru_068043 [Bulinus truncatus]
MKLDFFILHNGVNKKVSVDTSRLSGSHSDIPELFGMLGSRKDNVRNLENLASRFSRKLRVARQVAMTTVRSNADIPRGPAIPSYAYQYSTFHRVPLAAVKRGIFHPSPPHFRRLEMDSTLQKMSDEHSRNTTTCGPRDFENATTTLFRPPQQRLHCLNITDTGKQLHRHYTTPQELTKARQAWSVFLNKSPERFQIQLPNLNSQKDFQFDGYAVRYLRPELTQSWKYTLQPEPKLDQFGQKPLPANIHARFRDSYPQYHRNVASEMWR